MNYLWKIYPIVPDWDQRSNVYQGAVVCAKTEQEACEIYPGIEDRDGYDWPGVDWVFAEKIGTADSRIKAGTVILSDLFEE